MDVAVRRFISLVITVAALAGCRTMDPSVELLESELRWREDQLYSLDRQLDQTNLQLASARNSNRALRRELEELQRQPTPAASGTSQSQITPEDLEPPKVDVPNVEQFDEDSLQVPRIDLGPEPVPQSIQPSDDSMPPRLDTELDDFTRTGDVDVKVARISLNSRLTGGYDFDGKPGDEGLLVVVEPQNSAGQYLPLPGDLEIEVSDPTRQGSEARLALGL